MGITYESALDIQKKAEDISMSVFPHVKLDRVKYFRSYGSASRRTIARCHAMGKIMQLTLGVKAHYALEFISEKFDRLSEEEKTKVIIHELMHIPKSFGGGFKHHDYVCDKNINMFYRKYVNMKESDFSTEKIIRENELRLGDFRENESRKNEVKVKEIITDNEQRTRLKDFFKW